MHLCIKRYEKPYITFSFFFLNFCLKVKFIYEQMFLLYRPLKVEMFDDYDSYSKREGLTPYEIAEQSMRELIPCLYLKSDLVKKLEGTGGGAVLKPGKDYFVKE